MKNHTFSVVFILAIIKIPYVLTDHFPQKWTGNWFHLGFSGSLRITVNSIQSKGTCIHSRKNRFIMEENDSTLGKCFRCMIIHEKHFNVLQYKESFCEESLDQTKNPESLCDTIPGDAPLYSMFRKGASLVRCPFRGPFSFSYSKGGTGQTCEYPPSFMDTCAEGKRLQLRYQACTDVPGSESANEEMACLATWKDGASRYLVAMMNHSHVYTDEARYRCFVYSRQRVQPNEEQPTAIYFKMAQSMEASCLGLWNVDEGYKTYTLKKLDSDTRKCVFPPWLARHHQWSSLDSQTFLHINHKGRSFMLRQQKGGKNHVVKRSSRDSHVTCHRIESKDSNTEHIVAHIKAGCDSGFICIKLVYRDMHLVQIRFGQESRHPNEACGEYYFNDNSDFNLQTIVALTEDHNTRSCPFSGRYSLLSLPDSSLSNLIGNSMDKFTCYDHVMQAGCTSSSDLMIKSDVCYSQKSVARQKTLFLSFKCHGEWEVKFKNGLIYHHLVLSIVVDSTRPRRFVCLEYTEHKSVLLAVASSSGCEIDPNTGNELHSLVGTPNSFNITSSGPCLEALTGRAYMSLPYSGNVIFHFIVIVINLLFPAL